MDSTKKKTLREGSPPQSSFPDTYDLGASSSHEELTNFSPLYPKKLSLYFLWNLVTHYGKSINALVGSGTLDISYC